VRVKKDGRENEGQKGGGLPLVCVGLHEHDGNAQGVCHARRTAREHVTCESVSVSESVFVCVCAYMCVCVSVCVCVSLYPPSGRQATVNRQEGRQAHRQTNIQTGMQTVSKTKRQDRKTHRQVDTQTDRQLVCTEKCGHTSLTLQILDQQHSRGHLRIDR
jgi:hypothetical protein